VSRQANINIGANEAFSGVVSQREWQRELLDFLIFSHAFDGPDLYGV